MPLISTKYKAPWYFPGGMVQTIVAGRLPRPSITYDRETLELSDGDFLDLDWKRHGRRSLIILTHGLEGSSQSQYVTDFYCQMNTNIYDFLAWNCRSCSGRLNRLQKLYHHGEIEDLSEVVEYIVTQHNYEKIYLAGFSMGGNIISKFLVKKVHLAKHIEKSGIVSTPCDLAEAAAAMDLPKNKLIRHYFSKMLRDKLNAKESQFPGSFPMEKFDLMKSWYQFDDQFAAPFFGYQSADEFYMDASANSFLPDIDRPLYLINAVNDPILGPNCHPITIANQNEHVVFELSKSGGHVYFPMHNSNYAVRRVLQFFESTLA